MIISKAVETFEKEFPFFANKHNLKPFQEKVINAVDANQSTLAVMPTGGGKSLIYWVAARMLSGTCLVVSPLIALIDEQAEKLAAHGFNVLVLHGGMGSSEQVAQLKAFAKGENKPHFIFVSPERMATDGFFEYSITQQKDSIKLLVIDEIHCVSQWGFDFRPFYKHIPVFLNRVFGDSWPKLLGLTATINPKELHEISEDFKINKKAIFKDIVLLRFDIELKVEKLVSEDAKTQRLWELLDTSSDEKVLVYLYRKYRKHGVEDLCQKAVEKGIKALSFHGDMSGEERQIVLSKFKSGETNVIFATNAFGMGIDIPDIRRVIHFMLPESIEQYYQEIGRGGRDGNGAEATLLYTNKNIEIRRTHYINNAFPKSHEWGGLFKRATDNKSGYRSLQYFAEEELQSGLPYFLKCGALSIVGKGFTSLRIFKQVLSRELQQLIDSSRTGMVIPILKKLPYAQSDCRSFFDITYSALIDEKAKLSKNFDKCLIIYAHNEHLSQQQEEAISKEVEEKRNYKHDLLDYLVYLLDNFDSSQALHQDIGRYLGVDKHLLGKIHLAESGDWVRSKSEVIIANILHRSHIPFKYEERLYYAEGKWKEPDFTIYLNSKVWYWEHLGLLGDEKYSADWTEKRGIYKSMGILDKVITTKESNILSKIANEKVNELVNLSHDNLIQ